MRLFFLFVLIVGPLYSQFKPEGTWVGLLTKGSKNKMEGNTFSLSLGNGGDRIEGTSREEINGTDYFAIAKAYGELKDSVLSIKQVVFQEKKGAIRTAWCKLDMILTYNSITGYLEGNYKSSECRQAAGKVVLYRLSATTSDLKEFNNSPQTSEKLSMDLKKGRSAPDIREIERKNFQFKPVYFDYDKDEIRPEYHSFLTKMIDIVDGHSDLRIKVIGNTDSDGSDKYNIDLSKRRAQSIIDFFVQNGLSPDRIVIEYNGEKVPVDNNQTEEGKQRNRRVEFQFI